MKKQKIKNKKEICFANFFLKPIFIFFVLVFFFSFSLKVTNASQINLPPNNLGLVGYWSFEDATSTIATDFSGNRNHGTLTNMTDADWVNGKIGKALDFDGTNDYVSVADNNNLDFETNQAMSISAWVYLPAGVSGRIVGKTTPTEGWNTQGWRMHANASTGAIDILYEEGTTYFGRRMSGMVSDRWAFVAMSYDGSGVYTNINFYVDGQLLTSQSTFWNSPSINTGNADALTISRHHSISGDSYLTGKVDDLRIYNRALSATEITNLYNRSSKIRKIQSSQNDLVTNGLVGLWSFDGADISGTTALDRSGNANNGTLTNGPTAVIGKVGQGRSFDGTDDYVSLVENSSIESPTTSISFSTWIKLNASGSRYYIISKDYGSNNTQAWPSYEMYRENDGKMYLGVRTGSGEEGGGNSYIFYTTSSVMPIGEWFHIAGVWNYTGNPDTDGQFYINGIATTTTKTASFGTLTSIQYGSGGLGYVGATIQNSSSAITYFMNGSLDETRIYNRPLSTSEIQTLYRAGEAKVQSSQNNVLRNGLVGLWTFDGPDVSGTTIFDRSSNTDNGTLINGPVVSIGKISQAISFDGTNDYMNTSTTGLSFSTGDFAISFWQKSNGTQTVAREVFASGDDSVRVSYNNACVTDQPKGLAFIVGGTVSCTDNAVGTYTDGNWHHSLLTRTSGTVNFYHDGVLIKSFSAGGAVSANSFHLGKYAGAGLNYWNGDVDDLRVYNRTLSASEIQMLYVMGR